MPPPPADSHPGGYTTIVSVRTVATMIVGGMNARYAPEHAQCPRSHASSLPCTVSKLLITASPIWVLHWGHYWRLLVRTGRSASPCSG